MSLSSSTAPSQIKINTDKENSNEVVDEIRARIINVERKINILLKEQVVFSQTDALAIADDFRDSKYGARTYAQHGDDLVILNIFDMIKIEKPSYLDIGAHDPFKISNTALLYQRGCRGINVEANPGLIKAFHTQRPEDINLNVGVAAKSGRCTFFMFDERSGLNTLDPEQARRIESGGRFRVKKEIDVPVVTISQILEDHWSGNFPDFLSLDVEGLDLDVLMSIDFDKSLPKLICAEANSAELARKMEEFLVSKGYYLYFRACANRFFLRNDFINAIRN